jgi:enoyl-CoA hydratase
MARMLLIDNPISKVRRLRLNPPAKRNAIDNDLRSALFTAAGGRRRPRISATIIRGAGTCFSAGYDLATKLSPIEPPSALNDGWWPRHVVAGWFEMWTWQRRSLLRSTGGARPRL